MNILAQVRILSFQKALKLGSNVFQSYISDRFGIEYEISNIYRLLHHLNFSWITSRSRHPKQDEGVQTFFKKLSNGNDPSHPLADPIR